MPTKKFKRKVYRKAKRMARRFFRRPIRRPRYDTNYKVTCDGTTPILTKDIALTFPGGAPPPTYPQATTWMSVHVFHSIPFVIPNVA